MIGHHVVHRQHDLHAGPLRLGERRLHPGDPLGVEQRTADLVALRGQEGVGHPAADQQPVGELHQVADDPQLVGDLGAAEHDHVRPGRVLGELA